MARPFDGELVVVGDLFAPADVAQGEDDDALVALDVDDTREAVGLAGMVDEAGRVAMHGSIHYFIVINAEHVTADSLALIIPLALFSKDRANDSS